MKSTSVETINSIPQLIEELKNADSQAVGSVLQRMHITQAEVQAYTSWCEDGYTRNCIFRNEELEIIALCWKAGQATSIHGHGGQRCWVYQAYGSVEEQRYELDDNDKLIQTGKEILMSGKLCYMDDNLGFHLISNTSKEDAVSLHVYAKPIDTCQIYDEDKSNFEKKILQYDQDWSKDSAALQLLS